MRKISIALDLGGTRIKIGIIEHGNILSKTIIEAYSEKGLMARLSEIEKNIAQLLLQTNSTSEEVVGIGISIPGIVDTRQKKLLSVNKKYRDAVDFDFVAWAKQKWGLPFILENDARSALVGEWQYGAGKGCDNLVMVTLGTGVGGATIIEGNLLHGKHFQAGCLAGHFTINHQGSVCNCGNIGCVESEASSWRLSEMARNHPLYSQSQLATLNTIDYQQVFEYAARQDALATIIVNQSLEVWSAGVINQIHAYDPEIVILGGGIMKSKDLIIPYIQEKVSKHAWTPWGKVLVKPAENPDWAALLGINYLICHTNP